MNNTSKLLSISILLGITFSQSASAQSLDGTGSIPKPPPAELKTSNASELINLIYQALPLAPMKKILPPKEIQVYFNIPNYTADGELNSDTKGELSKQIVELLKKAKSEVIFSAGIITDKDIAGTLVSKKLEGVVTAGIITESPPGIKSYTAPSYFIVNNLPIFFTPGKTINTNNFIVIDRTTVILVSGPMTRSSLEDGNSSVMVITDPGIAVAYYNAWVEQLSKSRVPRVTQSILNTLAKAPATAPRPTAQTAQDVTKTPKPADSPTPSQAPATEATPPTNANQEKIPQIDL